MLVSGVYFFSRDARKTSADAWDYYNTGLSLRAMFIGVTALTIFTAAFFSNQQPDWDQYIMSYFFLALGPCRIATRVRNDPLTERSLGHLIRRTDQVTEPTC